MYSNMSICAGSPGAGAVAAAAGEPARHSSLLLDHRVAKDLRFGRPEHEERARRRDDAGAAGAGAEAAAEAEN